MTSVEAAGMLGPVELLSFDGDHRQAALRPTTDLMMKK
jgi:hypothetical protein